MLSHFVHHLQLLGLFDQERNRQACGVDYAHTMYAQVGLHTSDILFVPVVLTLLVDLYNISKIQML